ncbi:MAG: hypothetical protein ACYDBJ_18260 [Aggregatilineales bacterium]
MATTRDSILSKTITCFFTVPNPTLKPPGGAIWTREASALRQPFDPMDKPQPPFWTGLLSFFLQFQICTLLRWTDLLVDKVSAMIQEYAG